MNRGLENWKPVTPAFPLQRWIRSKLLKLLWQVFLEQCLKSLTITV